MKPKPSVKSLLVENVWKLDRFSSQDILLHLEFRRTCPDDILRSLYRPATEIDFFAVLAQTAGNSAEAHAEGIHMNEW